MSHSNFVRSVYRLIIRSHPRTFREQFGDEMSWIFDQEQQHGAAPRLLVDGLLSLVRQRIKVEEAPQPALIGFTLLDTSPGIAPRRIVQAGISATAILAIFAFLLGKAGQPIGTICLPAAPYRAPYLVQAPSRVQDIPDLHRRPNPNQIDNAVVSAIRITQAQQLSSNSQSSRFCPQN
jgi:hypothetical protein